MASTLTGTMAAKLSVKETMIAADVPNVDVAADATLQFAIGSIAAVASVTKVASMSKALSGGAATLDLTALTHRGVAVDFTGLKVKYAAISNPSTNANAITLVEGASNGIALFGASFSITLQPGDSHIVRLTASPTVAAADKAIDMSGTGSQALDILLLAGA